MPRNRYKKKETQALPPPPPPATPAPVDEYPSKLSPAAQAIANRIASGGPQYLMENLIHVMLDSSAFAKEPEFADVSIDGEKAVKVTERWSKKYKDRLAAAEKKGTDEYEQVFDRMRIEIIDELLTPALRKDIKERMQKLLNRLMPGEDHKKLEIAFLLNPLLNMKKVPWGICGLILAIYDRSMQNELQIYEQQNGIYQAVVEALKENGEGAIDQMGLIQSPKKLEQIMGKMLKSKPGLLDRVEKQAWELLLTFEKKLIEGKVILDLFTEAELALPFQRLKAQTGMPIDQALEADHLQKESFDFIVQTINEMMTPERYQRLRKDVQSMIKTWTREHNKWAPTLRYELSFLEEVGYEQNKFVLAAFFGQLSRTKDEL